MSLFMPIITLRMAHIALICVLSQVRIGSSMIIENRTVDDQYGDSVTHALPTYIPADGWAQGAECNGCNINRTNTNTDQAFNKTWHDSTYHPGGPERAVSVTFSGIAVYVFCPLANSYPYTTTYSNITFYLDNEFVGNYEHIPDIYPWVQFNVAVYKHEALPNRQHTLDIRAGGPIDSLILFDYIIYTFSDEPDVSPNTTTQGTIAPTATTTTDPPDLTTGTPIPSASPSQSASKSRVGVIAGGAAGMIVALIVLVGVIVIVKRQRSRQRMRSFPDDSNYSKGAGNGNGGHADVCSDSARPRATSIHSLPRARAEGPVENHSELVRRIQALEAESQVVEERCASEKSAFPDDSGWEDIPAAQRGESSAGSTWGGRTRPGSISTIRTRDELARLRNEIAMLRAELAYNERLMEAVEAPPLYSE